ncbi:MAG: Ig-like domain-containing protein, partial [Candidatus Latescibacterota bacterium]
MYWFLICFFFSIHFNSAMAQTSEPQLITLSGTGSLGYNGDDQAATQAQINYPQGLAVDQAGNVYIADSHNQRIRKINPQTGIITTVAGNGGHGYSGNNNQATQAELGAPLGVFIDTNNNLFIADTENNRIRKVDAQTNVITTIAGTGIDGYSGDGGPATQATFWHPQDVFVTNTGDIFVADTKNNCIRKIDAQTGIITTVAGTGQYGYSGDDSLATQASLAYPSAVWVTNTGDIYIVDRSNHRIRKVDAQTGIITTIGPTKNNLTPLNSPSDIVIDENGAFYVSDSWHNQILKLEDNTYSIVAGTGQPGFTEGNPLQASLNYPSGIAIDNNTLYVTDRFNHSIRSITNINQIVTRPVLLDTISKFYQPQRPPPPKTAPIAIPDTVEFKPNSRINVYVLRNDYDNEGDPLTVTTTTQGTHSERVVINDNDTIHYRPLPNYEGEDQFSYTISDGKGGTATAQVLITVIDRPPFVNRSIPFQSFFLNENANIDLGGSRPVIYDPQDEPLRLSATSQDSTIVIPTINGYQLTL